MEVEAACILGSRSEARGLRYTGFLSDGDSYNDVVKLDVYDMPIVKEECKPCSQKNGYCIEKSHQAEKVKGVP